MCASQVIVAPEAGRSGFWWGARFGVLRCCARYRPPAVRGLTRGEVGGQEAHMPAASMWELGVVIRANDQSGSYFARGVRVFLVSVAWLEMLAKAPRGLGRCSRVGFGAE